MVDAPTEPEFTFEVPSFRSGLVRFPHYSQSPVDSVRLAQNCVFTGQGYLTRRPGLSAIADGEFGTADELLGIVSEGVPRDRKLHVIHQDQTGAGAGETRYRQYDGSSWGGTGGVDMAATIEADRPMKPAWARRSTGEIALFTPRSDGIGIVNTENGSVPADIHTSSNETTLTASSGTNPPGHTVILHFKDRLWVAGGFFKPNTDRYRIYYSNILDPETWDNLFQFIPISNVGESVIGMAGWRNEQLAIGTETELWLLAIGQSQQQLDWALKKLSGAIGVGSHYSMIVIRDDLFFMDQYGDIRSLKLSIAETSGTLESLPVSFPIRDDIRLMIVDTPQVDPQTIVAAKLYEGNYLIGELTAGSDAGSVGIGQVFLFDTQHLGWLGPMLYQNIKARGLAGGCELTGEFVSETQTQATARKIREYIALNSITNPNVYEITGDNDDGTAITVILESQVYDFGQPHVDKILKWVEIEFDGTDGFMVEGSVDFGSFTTWNASVSVSGTGVRRAKVRNPQMERGRVFQIRITSSDAGSTPPIFRKLIFSGHVLEQKDE